VTSSPHLSVGEVPISSTRLTLKGSGSGVEGLTSGRPDPRPAERAMKNTMMLYKYFTTRITCCPMKMRELAAAIFLKGSVILFNEGSERPDSRLHSA